MPLSTSAPARARTSLLTRLSTVVAGSAIAATALTVAAPAADAVPTDRTATSASTTQQSSTQQSSTRRTHLTARQRYDNRAQRVLQVVRNQKGDPYRYGATGPGSFDCSGLMVYAFRKALGRTIPRVANDQKRASRIVHHRSNLRPGDLVFEVSGGNAYHVGIYAGHGYFWHAPHSGSHVKRQKMYPANWVYGRLIRS